MAHEQAHASPSATRAAKRVLRKLEGTLVPDLRSMIKWASEFDSTPDQNPDLGALNFTLMLVALIGCEALGYYTEGAYRHLRAVRDECPRPPDPGVYLMQVIQHHFPRGSFYKHLGKVLADELRHDLVHGFGSLGRRGAVRLALALKSDTTVELKVGKRHGKDTIVINAVAFADQFLAAFRHVKDLVDRGSDPGLVSRIARATRSRWPVGQGVRNQFESAYNIAMRRGLVLGSARRRRRPVSAREVRARR